MQAFAAPSYTVSAFAAADGLSPVASPQRVPEATVRPHALTEHVPGLLGPLVPISGDTGTDDSDEDADWDDPACSLLVLG